MKNRIGFFLVGCFAWFLSSCLGSDDPVSVDLYKNCQIATFTLQHDSISALSKVKFTIDQVNGRIFNADSLPYGTVVEKLICTVTYESQLSISATNVDQTVYGDSTLVWDGKDSLNFAKPVKIEVVAFDKLTSKTYIAQVNVHQQVPDSMMWSQYATQVPGISIKEQQVVTAEYAGTPSYFMYVRPADNSAYRLYQAPVANPKSWTQVALTGLPASGLPLTQITRYEGAYYLPSATGVLYRSTDGQAWTVAEAPLVKYLLGAVKEGQGQSSSLAGIVDKDGTLIFASMDKNKVWTMGEAVPSLFPVTGFGTTEYYSMYHYYRMVAAGRDKDNQLLNNSWATMDGRSWAKLTDDKADNFGKREGVMLTAYDDKYFLIGGLTEDGKGSKDIYTSIDRGMNWALQDSMVLLPDDYTARGFSSIQVDSDQFMYIFAGKTGQNTTELNDIWRGRINRLGFAK